MACANTPSGRGEYMKAVAGMFLAGTILGGCAAPTLVKPGVSNHQAKMDAHKCEAFARGVAPMPMPQPVGPSSSTTYHSGQAYGQGGSVSYSGTSTTMYNNSNAQLANSIAQIGASFRQQEVAIDCMRSLGYREMDTKTRSHKFMRPVNAPDSVPRESAVRTATITAEHLPLKLYTKARADSEVIASITAAQTLSVLRETDGMFEVRSSSGQVGWIGKTWLEFEE